MQPMKKTTGKQFWFLDSLSSPKDSKWLDKNLKGMDDEIKTIVSSSKLHELSLFSQTGRQAQLKDQEALLDASPELRNTDNCHKCVTISDEYCRHSDDTSCTTNSDAEFNNSVKLKSELQTLTQENERLRTDSEKLRGEYKVQEQRLGQFQMDFPKLKEEKETLQKERVGESDTGMNLGSQIDPRIMQIMEPAENIDQLPKDNIKMAEELQAEIRRGQKLAEKIDGSQKALFCLEKENEVLKTELQKSLHNNNGSEKQVSNSENERQNGVSAPEMYECISAEHQEQYAVLGRQNERSLHKESCSEDNNLQEGNSKVSNYVSSMQQETKSHADETNNLLMEKDNVKNQLSRKSGPIEEQIASLQQEVQAKAELVQDLKKQNEDLQLAFQESQCENARIANKHERCIEEHDVVNAISKTFKAELAHSQQENQKLRKELSSKATDLKNLQMMFSSLGKEKEVMATELALKVRILADMEEHLNDLKEQNKTLSNKLEAYAREHKSKTREMQGTITLLRNRDKLLADQLLKTLEGCRALKRRLKEMNEHNKGLKKEIGNLKSSIQKQEESTHIMESERTALQNELTWGEEQLHSLQEKCKCFKREIESVTKQDLTIMDRQKNFNEEIVLLEQLLLHFKEEIICFKAESDRREKECQQLKEEIVQLQTELSNLRMWNSSLEQKGQSAKIEKKVSADNLQRKNVVLRNNNCTSDEEIKNMDKECKELKNKVQEMVQEEENENLFLNNSLHNLKQDNQCLGLQLQHIYREDDGAKMSWTGSVNEPLLLLQDRNTDLEEKVLTKDNSIKMLKDASDMAFCEKEDHEAEVSHKRDIAIQVSNKSSVIQKLEDGVSSIEQGKKALCSEIGFLANRIRSLYQVVYDSQISRPYTSEAKWISNANVQRLEVTFKEIGKTNGNKQNEREILEAYGQELYKQLIVSKQYLKEIEEQISRLAYERNFLVLEVSNKASSMSELEKQFVNLQKEISAKVDETTLWNGSGFQNKKRMIQFELQVRVEQITQVEDRIRKLQEESDGTKGENVNLESECQQMRENCSSLKKIVQDLPEEHSKTNEDVKLREIGHYDLQEEISWTKNSISEAAAITQTVGQGIQMLGSKNLSLQKELSIKVEEFGKVNEDLRRQVDELHQENSTLDNASNADGSQIHELQLEMGKLEMEVEKLRDENGRQKIIMCERGEEKREAIRQLCFALDHWKEENTHLQRILSSIMNDKKNRASTITTAAS